MLYANILMNTENAKLLASTLVIAKCPKISDDPLALGAFCETRVAPCPSCIAT